MNDAAAVTHDVSSVRHTAAATEQWRTGSEETDIDARELMVTVAAHHYVARQLGLAPAEIFDEAARRPGAAGPAEEALAAPGQDREDRQPQLVREIVPDQRAGELAAGVDDDVPVHFLLQLRDFIDHVAGQHRHVGPLWTLGGRGHEVLGQAVQAVRPPALPGPPSNAPARACSAAYRQAMPTDRLPPAGHRLRRRSWPDSSARGSPPTWTRW